MTRICFIRHGETDWNIEQRMQGHLDLALNENGEAQARALGTRFAPGQAVAIYCSDLLRARQTAQPVAEALNLRINLSRALRERNFGRCEGLTLVEVAERHPEDAEAIRTGDPDYAFPGGESRRQHKERILRCVAELAGKHPGQSIVVVTHGGVLDVVYRRAGGLPDNAPRSHAIPNAGINWIAIADEEWIVEAWGDTGHLA